MTTTSNNDEYITLIFIYRLTPANLCTNFKHGSATYAKKKAGSFSYAVWQDMLTLTYRTLRRDAKFDEISRQADFVVRVIISGWTFFARESIEYTRTNWVEFTGISRDIVVGKSDAESYPEDNHPDSKPFVELEKVFAILFNNAPLRRALDDFRSCLAEVSPDLYFYAYRAVENVRSHFQTSETDEDRQESWNKMNTSLNRKEEDYRELVELSKKYRHNNPLEDVIDSEIASRQFTFAHSLIEDFIAYLTRLSIV